MAIGIAARMAIAIGIDVKGSFALKMMKKVDTKATIIKAIEKKSVLKPISNLKGRDLRKSSCAYREVRMPKNITIAMLDETKESASAIAKLTKIGSRWKIGMPLFWSSPPGNVSAEVNAIVATRAATTKQEVAVVFIHFSPSFLSFS